MERFLLQYSNWTVDVYLAFTVVAVCFGLLACDSGDPGDTGGNQPPTAVAEANPTDTTAGTEVTFDGSGSKDPDGDAGSLTYNWEFDDGATGSGETVSHTYESAGEYTAELSVSDGESSKTDEVAVSIKAPPPDSVAITYRPLDTDGNVLEDAHVSDGDVTGTGEFTDSVAYSTDTREVTAERDGYEDGSSTYTPTSSQTVEIELAEKTAEVTVKAEALETETQLASSLELSADGETVASGASPLTTEVSVNVDELTASAAEHERESEVYADTSETFVIEDSPVTLGQRRVPHCVNGLDNDGDELVGVWTDEDGNDIPTKGDSGDPGCRSQQDDGEVHEIYTVINLSTQNTVFISPAEGERKILFADRSSAGKLPATITEAVGNIYVSDENRLESDDSGEDHVLRIEIGTDDNMTDVHTTPIVADDPSVDGWRTSVFLDVLPSWFEAGLYYRVTAVHGCKADSDRDCESESGGDIGLSNQDHGFLKISFAYESDKGSKQAMPKAAESGDVTVRSTGYVTGQ
ncbi:MAG: hypothetical protein BRD42_09430 [Bacteroidetes bacterium QS_3_64_15]|nr:MAG: hypothetical protein BRD42_09430 [Bacteroidetes bacterium QS_3_64_15]